MDFSLDNDNAVDSNEAYTSATLKKNDMPPSFTICAAYMIEAWPTDSTEVRMFVLQGKNFGYGYGAHDSETAFDYGYVSMYAAPDYTEYEARFAFVHVRAHIPAVYIPLQWTRVCVSLDTDSSRVRLVVEGKMLGEAEYNMEEDDNKPPHLNMQLGVSRARRVEFTGSVSSVNIFSSALSLERMVGMTTAGGEECGAPGDYLSWEEEEWTLHSAARMVEVEASEGPCRRESKMQLFTKDSQDDCMEHCQKIANGRSPLVVTKKQYKALEMEMATIINSETQDNTKRFVKSKLNVWLAATKLSRPSHWPETLEVEEGVWRDYYTGEKIEEYKYKYYDTPGVTHNCMAAADIVIGIWRKEWPCDGFDMSCICEYEQQPLLSLRGLCSLHYTRAILDSKYAPVQIPGDPPRLQYNGFYRTRIEFNSSTSLWSMTDTLAAVSAVTYASKQSYVLGKHEWEITNDTHCNRKQPNYTTQLKLTGCDQEGEFTCDDGQCVRMEKRRNQLPNCRDKSDERGCQLLVLEGGYNMKVPPITAVSSTNDTVVPTQVNISLVLKKVVEIEEVDHSIHLKFQIILEWKETRATFLNLKHDTTLNTLTDEDINRLWLPLVIYDNTDQEETTRPGSPWEWMTTVTITREGEFTRSGMEEVDEAEIFQGRENRLTMYQTYTHEFQCVYKLTRYPFDTQVT